MTRRSTSATTRDLQLLGRSETRYPAKPSAKTLETFPNRFAQRNYWIRFDCPEFTSLCPVTGQPDFAKIRIEYVPDARCIETKSLKFYLASFRNTRSFNEEVSNRILEDIVAACQPRRIRVHGEFSARGGVSVTVDVSHPRRTGTRPAAPQRVQRFRAMKPGDRAVVLLSGGMDSVAALYDTAGRADVVAALSFHYGSKHNDREIPFAAWHARKLGVPHLTIPLDFIGKHFASDLLAGSGDIPKGHYEEDSMKKTVVPFRNGIMLAVAAGFAESKEAQALVIAAHAGDHAIYPDCREDFMRAMGDAMRLGTYANIELARPFIAMTKAQIAARGAELGVDFSQTWSCYVGGEIHCGECGTCVERREAFQLAGLDDPTGYASHAPLPPRPVAA